MTDTDNHNKDPLLCRCPGCGTQVEWSDKFPDRPFCSERCRNGDFVAWAEGERAIPGNPTYDDLLSDQLLNDPGDN